MSAQYFEFFIQPSDDEAAARYLNFAAALEQANFDDVQAMDAGQHLDECEYLDGLIDEVSVNEQGSAPVVLEMDGSTTIDPEALIRFLVGLGAERIETRIFNSQVGEYLYFEDSEYRDAYGDADWRWLEEPEVDDDDVVEEDAAEAEDDGAIPAVGHAAEARRFAGSPLQPFLDVLGVDEHIDPRALLTTLDGDSILGRRFRDWLSLEILGEGGQVDIELSQVAIYARHADATYHLQVDFHPIVEDGEKVRHVDLESILAHLEGLDVPFIKTNFHSTTVQCEWIGDDMHARLKLLTGQGSLVISGPDESILDMSLENLVRWYMQAGGTGTRMRTNPVVSQLIASKLAADPGAVDNYYYLRYRLSIHEDFDEAERFLGQGVEAGELECIFLKARQLGDSWDKAEFMEGMRLMELACERDHPTAQRELERMRRTLEDRKFDAGGEL